MSQDTYTVLNPGNGGDVLDEQLVTYSDGPTDRKRQRIVNTGTTPDSIADVVAAPTSGTEMGLLVREIEPASADVVTNYGITTLVATNIETTVCNYVVPTGKTLRISGFTASGDITGKYTLYINGSPVVAHRSSVPQPTVVADFSSANPIATTGQTVTIRAIHWEAGKQANFEATLFGRVF